MSGVSSVIRPYRPAYRGNGGDILADGADGIHGSVVGASRAGSANVSAHPMLAVDKRSEMDAAPCLHDLVRGTPRPSDGAV